MDKLQRAHCSSTDFSRHFSNDLKSFKKSHILQAQDEESRKCTISSYRKESSKLHLLHRSRIKQSRNYSEFPTSTSYHHHSSSPLSISSTSHFSLFFICLIAIVEILTLYTGVCSALNLTEQSDSNTTTNTLISLNDSLLPTFAFPTNSIHPSWSSSSTGTNSTSFSMLPEKANFSSAKESNVTLEKLQDEQVSSVDDKRQHQTFSVKNLTSTLTQSKDLNEAVVVQLNSSNATSITNTAINTTFVKEIPLANTSTTTINNNNDTDARAKGNHSTIKGNSTEGTKTSATTKASESNKRRKVHIPELLPTAQRLVKSKDKVSQEDAPAAVGNEDEEESSSSSLIDEDQKVKTTLIGGTGETAEDEGDEEEEENGPSSSIITPTLPTPKRRKPLEPQVASLKRSLIQTRRDVTGKDGERNKCDRLFLSSANAPRNGTFSSPTIFTDETQSQQCIYNFVARPGERVELVFTEFNVRGQPPECVHEWVDLYTEVEDTDVENLISTPFGGRFCGRIPPRRRISLYGGIAIGFYTDKNYTDETIFQGMYGFFDETKYLIGTPVPRTICSYTILGTVKRQGDLLSPTYPGAYPKDLSCSYKFIGIPGQRIRLEFRDFDLFFGGSHCPFDDVKVYDGMEPSAPLIAVYCGQHRNLVVYSSEHLMLVTFTTMERITQAQNRGFAAVWEFSESFVKLGKKENGEHIRGTECDQKILSKGQSSGSVYSPNYPFPYLPKIVCRYFIYGLQDPQHLERVRLSFEKFDVPSNTNSEQDLTAHASVSQKCGDGYLKIYLKGQEVLQAYDKPDYEFCGKDVPHDVVSDGPRLALVFSSGETQGSGFKSRYYFETEYRVPGTPAPDGSCAFTYYSSSHKRGGEFNSPRFPSNYPSETNCTYIFHQQPNEQVRIVFDNFKLKAEKVNYTGGAYGSICEEDWVEIYNVMPTYDRIVGRYCGTTAPGPIESRERATALKIILHTDSEGVYSGFKARYIYFNAKSIFGECGMNITQAHSGVLTTPQWPNNYDGPSKGEGSATCNWYLTVNPGSHVMLHFQVFAIEGEPNSRGCPAAAVRIWEDPDGVPVELCGESLLVQESQYVSTDNIMRVTFIIAEKAVGAKGFRAVWTEVKDRAEGSNVCDPWYFPCPKSKFCIPVDLRCNGEYNCGTSSVLEPEFDHGDEEHCGLDGEMNMILLVTLVLACTLCLSVGVCVLVQRKKRKRRRRLQLRRPPIHVCDNAGARYATMDSV